MATQMQANVSRTVVRIRSKLSRDGRPIEAAGLCRGVDEQDSNIFSAVPTNCSKKLAGCATVLLLQTNDLLNLVRTFEIAIWAIELGD
jgi:hypothetical protein